MTCRSDAAGTWTYRTCPEDPPVAADRLRAVVRWSVVDEITQRGPSVDYAVRTDALGLLARIAGDGVMGLIGNPARLYPGLDTGSSTIAWTVSAPGYLPRERSIVLGPVAGFPDQFAPADDGVLALHRPAIVLRGRVIRQLAGHLDPDPQPGVAVSLAGVWWTFPPADVDPTTVMQPADLISLAPGLYADRASGADAIRMRVLSQIAGQDKTLARPAVTGDTTVRLSDRVGLAAGSVLAFEPDRPDRVEYVAITSVTGASTDDQPATATLAHRLLLAHEQGTAVHVVAPQAAAAPTSLVRDGVRGDRVGFITTVAGLSAGTVEISGGAAPVEYQTASRYAATSDAAGYYRLPPLSRVASVKLQTPTATLVTSPDYGRFENLVDLVQS